MNIVIAHDRILPAPKYGGTERVIWYLGKELVKMGHKVTFVAGRGSKCDFANVIPFEDITDISTILPKDVDIVHSHAHIQGIEKVTIPKVFTLHGNINNFEELDENTIFVSKNHANRYNSNSYVHNGLDWNDYGSVDLSANKKFFHFLGNGASRVKNLRGAIELVKKIPKEKLYVFGGVRFNFNMGIRLTFTPKARFFGLIDNNTKKEFLPHSKGLIFPVLWHEPFGLAIIESLYFGNPVFGTPYGSLPELVIPEVGFLSNSRKELKEAMQHWQKYDSKVCHQYAKEHFNSQQMAKNYMEKYIRILDGEKLNTQKPKLLQVQPKFLAWNQ
ncbi:glycosyltransferase [Capnocytophaga cynodegmi]|uniref:glycosyltransferase n=1 Tax=Capnocytophaga cynodegmi TaxID=28189 RepID=UPI00385FC6A8